MGSRARRANSMISPSKKHTNHNHGEYDYPDQNDVNESNKLKYNTWMEMIKNKRDRSLNRADRSTK